MKRTYWYWILIIGAALAFSNWRSFAAEVEYISPAQKTQLADEFAKAKPLANVPGKWLCDMYGTSSNIQTLKSVQLSTVLKSVNRNGVKLEMRQSHPGQLVSKLSHDGEVVAYSRCRLE
jgi:hypothetical protein